MSAITVELDEDLLARLKDVATVEHRTPEEIIVMILAEYLPASRS
jgi:predicted transcriptional regulator